ncbi:FAD/NADP-binding domain-containing protein [Dacryopinax primogenitus]|uniref:FAD/NADP-binding domain-containing protein n=1 Tax=Dacryopinax primogenitus (strain DJM 731) TaxID=1858805 RepID=M5G5B6_DACPD|nr:FAD/NADP-binding domain-containing protein [Dacryopinax primogenitus]EJT98947.1 FAD/NADP-binding domain-containing protein [Dacryopinax primogenitus]
MPARPLDYGTYVPPTSFPSFTKHGASLLPSTAAAPVSSSWLSSFASAIHARDIPCILDHLLPDAYWKDMLSLTWDFRAFQGQAAIRKFLEDRLALCEVRNVRLTDKLVPSVVKVGELSWVQASAEFDTKWGSASLVFRLVPYLPEPAEPAPNANGLPTEPDPEWCAFALFSNLDSLHGVIEQVGAHRVEHPPRKSWNALRAKELEFEQEGPTVLIIGGGHNGTMMAARLKYMGISCLIIEKEPRVGNQWRGRYSSLCTHDPVWFTQLPYLPFPSTWPTYTPADKLGDWLEAYASHLDLNVWLSSSLSSVTYSPEAKEWTAHIQRSEGTRELKAKHVVYAGGWNGVPYLPEVEGREEYEKAGGKVLHSSEYRDAKGFQGKKVVVIGAGVSAHDIAQDLINSGAGSVTLHQRSPTLVVSTRALRVLLNRSGFRQDGLPVDTADMLLHSFPMDIQKLTMAQSTKLLKDVDKDTLEGLDKKGFMLDDGPQGAGYLFLVLTRRGGYYFDVGASQLIIDGEISLKAGGEVSRLTPGVVHFTDNSTLPADVVVFATGFGAIKENLAQTFGEEFTAGLKDPWYLDEEGELRAVWRDSGQEGFWYMIGNLSYARFYSRRVALRES